MNVKQAVAFLMVAGICVLPCTAAAQQLPAASIDIGAVKAAFDAGNLTAARVAAEQVLAGDAGNKRAQQYVQLIDAKLRAKEALSAADGADAAAPVKENTVAVVSFVNTGEDKSLDPLQKALAEMVITDLAQVKRLTIIERMQSQALMTEMALGMSGLLEEASVAKMGKVLGAAKVVNGSFKKTEEGISMDAGLADAQAGGLKAVPAVTGKLEDIFKLQKEMVFALIGKMGIVLSDEEKKAIQVIPTENVLALLAYGKALDAADNGNFDAAAGYMQEASAADPHYGADMTSQVADDVTPVFTESAPVAAEEEEVVEEPVVDAGKPAEGFDGNSAVSLQVLNNVNSGFMPEAQIATEAVPSAPAGEAVDRNSYIDSQGLEFDGGTKAVDIKVPIPEDVFTIGGGGGV